MAQLLLATDDDVKGYKVGEQGTWKNIRLNLDRAKKCSEAYVYFTERGIQVKLSTIIFDKQIRFNILKKLSKPITIETLRKMGVVSQEATLQGAIFYLDEIKVEMLERLFK